ncbi:O-methyltransferase [Streptomyces sp. NPDC059506]|uniref:Class I SAM-dependent methyltransferase n=1 Tax=Streptomyces thermolineatus TaxID=44033 RepID=A0ABN3MPP9_9ACTN
MTESRILAVDLPAGLRQYVPAQNPQPDPVEQELIDRTRELGGVAGMQVSPAQAALLRFLVGLTGARNVVEIGTFTGYSTLAMARALPDGGRLTACDVSREWTALGQEAWAKAGVADRIDLRIAPALETLRAMPAEPRIDMAFLDADKEGYIAYWEELVPRMRPGGLLVVDNTLFHGEVGDPGATGAAAHIRAFNDHVRADRRTESVLLALEDGVTLARRL